MREEISMLEKNSTWEMVERPGNKPVVSVRWIFKTKLNLDGSIQKHKTRLVAKGYTQKPEVDFNETFAPVARLDIIRTLIALATQKNWKLFQLDVKSAFLNGVLKEEAYIEQPEGFEVKGAKDKVYKLRKALYGLKQVPRAWYGEIDTHPLKCEFQRSISEATLYVKIKEDDIVYTGSCNEMLKKFKDDMMNKYEMTNLGLLHHFLGMGVIQKERRIFIHQQKYAKTLLNKFGLKDCIDEETYKKIVGSLLYLIATKPDIMYSASLLARFMYGPSKKHFGVARRILSDWSGSEDDMKSTFGYAFSFGSGAFSWASVTQSSVALSTAEAEYVSDVEATTQEIWLRFVLCDFREEQLEATPIMCDNTFAIAMSKNPVFHQRSKHIGRKFHFIRDAIQEGVVGMIYCRCQDQIADFFTKALTRERFCCLRELLGVKSVKHLEGSVDV
ncbi:unnamed protein product [Prunus armeniaca]